MENKKYGLVTAVAMVVGSVIGSGVFFKTEVLINICRGNGKEALIAWLIGGISMLLCLLSFADVTKYAGCENGLVEITEKTVGGSYAYFMGWFAATVYYPALTSVLSWLSARYTLMALGMEEYGDGLCLLLACVYLATGFFQNAFFPRFSGRLQVVTTVLKLIPLLLMIVFGTARGTETGILFENMSKSRYNGSAESTLFSSITAVMFAYEGWIAALSVGKELRNSRRNLPVALSLGGVVIALVYVLYYVGIMGSVPAEVFFNYGKNGIKTAFEMVFGKSASGILIVFVAISCLGALNGMAFSSGRAMYLVSQGEYGGKMQAFAQVDNKSNTPTISFIAGTVFSLIWLFFFWEFSVADKPLFGEFGFDSSEIPVVSLYLMYIPVFYKFLKSKGKTIPVKSRIIIVLGIIACFFVAVCALTAHRNNFFDYACVYTGIMLAGEICKKRRQNKRGCKIIPIKNRG